MLFPSVRLLKQAAEMIVQQRRIIAQQEADIALLQQTVVDAELAYMRIGRDLMEQFLIALDKPEDHDEIRQRLKVGLGFYRDEIAVREEHA